MTRGQRRAHWRSHVRGTHLDAATPLGLVGRSRELSASTPEGGSPTPSGAVSITVSVRELSLRGFDRAQGRAIAVSLQRSLTGLLAERGPPDSWKHNTTALRVSAGALRLTPGITPERIGPQLAQAILACRADGRK